MVESELGGPAFWILTALATGRSHGYGVIRSVKTLSEGRVTLKVTTLYAALDRLEREGLVQPDGDEVVDGRLRSYFILTETGGVRLNAEIERMEANVSTARQQLRGATALGGAS